MQSHTNPTATLEVWFTRVARAESHGRATTNRAIVERANAYLQVVQLTPARDRERWMEQVDMCNIHMGIAIRNQYTLLGQDPPAMVRACGYLLAAGFWSLPIRLDYILVAANQRRTNSVVTFVPLLTSEEIAAIDRGLTTQGDNNIEVRSDRPEGELAPRETVTGRNLATGVYGEMCTGTYHHLEAWVAALARTTPVLGDTRGYSMPAIMTELMPTWDPNTWATLSNTEKLYCLTTYKIANGCADHQDGVHHDVEACGMLVALPSPTPPTEEDYITAGITHSGEPGDPRASIAQLVAGSWVIDEADRLEGQALTVPF